jgi:hypothetical protein
MAARPGPGASLTPKRVPSSLSIATVAALRVGTFLFCFSEQAAPDGPAMGNAPTLTLLAHGLAPGPSLRLSTSTRMLALFSLAKLLWNRAQTSGEINKWDPTCQGGASNYLPTSSSVTRRVSHTTAALGLGGFTRAFCCSEHFSLSKQSTSHHSHQGPQLCPGDEDNPPIQCPMLPFLPHCFRGARKNKHQRH